MEKMSGLRVSTGSEATRKAQETHWGEDLARALTDPVVSSLLMSFGMLGLLAILLLMRVVHTRRRLAPWNRRRT